MSSTYTTLCVSATSLGQQVAALNAEGWSLLAAKDYDGLWRVLLKRK